MSKVNKIFNIILKVFAIVVAVSYCFQLYAEYAIDEGQVLPEIENLIIIILRWLSIVTVGFMFVTPWWGNKTTRVIAPFFGLIIGILNFVFFRQNMIAWGSEINPADLVGYAYNPVRIVFFVIENVSFILMSGLLIFNNITTKQYSKLKPHYIILTVIGFLLVFFYTRMFDDIKSMYGSTFLDQSANDFSIGHIALLLTPILIIIGLSLAYRGQSYENKRLMLITISFAALITFFYVRFRDKNSISFNAIPVHLCNFATILIFLAYVFKLKGLFYFTLFVNVLGTIFAMIMPDYKDSYLLSYEVLRFWHNHLWVFVLPVLGITLNVFERPKMKYMLSAIGVFTGYFLIAAISNAIITNFDPGVNYFFLNDYFYLDKISLSYAVRDNYVWSFYLGNLKLTFYPLYHAAIYAIFIALMFADWYVMDFLFKISDSHRALREKKIIQHKELIDFRKILNGRSLREPLYKEDSDMIEIKHFTKVYSGSKTPSVDDLNLTINGGEVMGFLGHNGAGKSTTIKSLVGIQTITHGQMIIDGYDVSKQPVEAKLRVGYVSDNHAVYEQLTGREYINYVADLYMVSEKDRNERIEKYTKMFHLEDAIDNEIKSYSHGMKQKIVVIASLIHDPKVWILDEPLTGLDPTSSYQIKECMKEHASRGNVVFFSSHVIEVVEKVCTRICIISHGKLQCEYSLAELKEKGISLEELYLKYVSKEERIH